MLRSLRRAASLCTSAPSPPRAHIPVTTFISAPLATMADDAGASASGVSSSSRKYRVYTRTGDKGTSSLYNGQRRPKDDIFFDALGDVDELNAAIGLAREFIVEHRVGIEEQLVEIQSRLLDVGSAIATPLSSSSPEQLARVAFAPTHAEDLERWIDAMDDELPALKNFILPVRRRAGAPAPPQHPIRVGGGHRRINQRRLRAHF